MENWQFPCLIQFFSIFVRLINLLDIMQKNPLSKNSLIARRLDYLRAFRAAYTRERSEYTLMPVSIYEVSQFSSSGEKKLYFLQAGQPLPNFDDTVKSVFIERVQNAEVINLLNECRNYGIE